MRIFVFGNPDLPLDALPLKLLPKLRESFPEIAFEVLDPNENWEVPEHMYIIDTVVGLSEVQIFQELDAFMAAPRMTCHDFDAYANIMLMKKLGMVKDVTVIGVPSALQPAEALSIISEKITSLAH